MSSKSIKNDHPFRHLDLFIKQNNAIDFSTMALSGIADHPEVNWKKLDAHKAEILGQLKPFRRLLRAMPEGTKRKAIITLLGDGIQSAVQLAAMPKAKFLAKYAALFGDDPQMATTCYNKAHAIRSHVLIQYMGQLQSNASLTSSTKL